MSEPDQLDSAVTHQEQPSDEPATARETCQHPVSFQLMGYEPADPEPFDKDDDGTLDAVDYCPSCRSVRLWGVGWIEAPNPSSEQSELLIDAASNYCVQCGTPLGECVNSKCDACLDDEEEPEDLLEEAPPSSARRGRPTRTKNDSTMDLITEDTPYRDNQLCARHDGRILARVVEDSFANDDKRTRLTTLEVVVPRIVLAEFNTHRVFSRNSASSRAIPIEKMLQRVQEDPYIPETWGKNQKGMQAEEALSEDESGVARDVWLMARDSAVRHTKALLEIGVHKQTTNRLLEPFMWHTIIVTATDWSNFRHLRAHGDAHPAIQNPARAVIAVLDAHEPSPIEWEEWHLPYVHKRDRTELMDAVGVNVEISDRSYAPAQLSTARCARVSYLTHDGTRELLKDFGLHDSLLAKGHMSPFEHAAFASETYSLDTASNFAFPWIQYRKLIPFEADVYADPDREWKAAE